MDPQFIAILAFCLIGLTATLVGTGSGEGLVGDTAVRLGIPFPGDALTPTIRARLVWRRRVTSLGWWFLGALTGYTASVGTAEANLPFGTSTAALLFGCFAGAAVSALLVAIIEPRRTTTAPRVAHLRPRALGDYISAREMRAARILVAFSVLAAAVGWVIIPAESDGPLAHGDGIRALLLFGGIATLIAAVSFELGARRVLARPSIAHDSTELVWDDALRSLDIRTTLSWCSTIAASTLVFPLIVALLPFGNVVLWAIPPLALVGIVTYTIVTNRFQPARRFVRRLWPEIAAASAAPTPTPAEPNGGTVKP